MATRGGSTVWLDILPSLRGFGALFAKEAAGAGSKAGKQLGTAIEDAVGKASKRAAEVLAENVEDATERVKDAADGIAKANDKVADATGRVTVAEAKLTDARKKHGETDARTIAAQERLATATRAKERADREATKATEDHGRATAELGEAQKRLNEETTKSDGLLKRLTGSLSKVDTKNVDRGARSMAKFSGAAYASAAGIAAIGSSLPAVAGISAVMAQASGSALILPGALAAGGVAAGTLKLGLSGVGAALKEWDDPEKFAEKIKELSGNARGFAVEVRALRPELIGLRNSVQERLFAGAADDVKVLGKTYIPTLRKGLSGISEEFGLARRGLTDFAVQGDTVRDVNSLFSLTQEQVRNVRTALAPLVGAFLDLSVVGGESLARLTSGLGDNARGFAAFIAHARETGRIAQWIDGGLQALDDMGELFGNVMGIINTVLGAANAQGGSLFNTMIAVTGSVQSLLQSTQGQEALATFFRTVHDTVQNLMPGLQAVAGALLQGIIMLGPQIPPIAQAFSDVAIAVSPLIPDLVALAVSILPPIVSLIQTLAPAAGTLAAAFIGGYAALMLFNGAVAFFNGIRWIVGFYRAWAAGQIALNVAMTANPVGIIVAAIGALIAAIVYLWNNNEGFRAFFINAWAMIKAAVMSAWTDYIQPAFAAIVGAVRAVGDAAVWLWRNVFVPAWTAVSNAVSAAWGVLSAVFDAVVTGLKYAGTAIFTLLVVPYLLAFQAVRAAVMWLWENGIRPALEAIGDFLTWVYVTKVQPWVTFFKLAFQAVGAAALSLWQDWIRPFFEMIGNFIGGIVDKVVFYFNAWVLGMQLLWVEVQSVLAKIGAFFSWLWNDHILPFVTEVGLRIIGLGQAFQSFWNDHVQPALAAVGNALQWLWDNTIGRVFGWIKSGVGEVGTAFETAVGFIERVWGKLREILAKPVNFVIQTVYNDGIRAVWNKVAEFVGINGLPQMNPITFAGGGVISGYAPGRDTVPALLSRGEAVLVPEAVRLLGARNILALNASASGRPGNVVGGGFSGGGIVHRFAGGGIVGNLLDYVSGVGGMVADLWRDPTAFVKARMGSSGWIDMLARGPAKLVERGAAWLWAKVKDFFGFSSDAAAATAGAAGASPHGWQQMWEIIRSQFPAAILTSSFRPGDPGYHGKGRAIDIAGPMGAINSWIAKVYPNSTQLIYTPGVNLLNGRPFAYDGPTQADHHDHVHWAFDSGGYLMPGVSTVYNGTGKPEPVLTSAQWDLLADNGYGGTPVQLSGTLSVADNGLNVFVDGRIESANHATGTALARRPRL